MRAVELIEVGGRDGLQNESHFVESPIKLVLFQKLVATGITRLEATSFVSPKWIPQMADASVMLKDVQKLKENKTHDTNLQFSVLIPNIKGWEAALSVAVPDEILIFTAVSEAFCQKNINCTITESLARFEPVLERAKQLNIHVRASISCSLGCPYEGVIEPNQVLSVAKQLVVMGCTELSIADTIGVGTPLRVATLFKQLQDALPDVLLGGHFHDTYGQALANIYSAYQQGIRIFDSSVGGLGGCPYAKGATGNVASEDVVYMMQQMGELSHIDLLALAQTGHWISQQIGRPYTSRAGRALLIKHGLLI